MQDQPSAVRPGTRTEANPPLGRFYEVGGRRLLLHRSGSGTPAVVFLPGGGAVGLDYLNVQHKAAKLTTSVLYDRAGTGWSDRTGLPRTSAEVTSELRQLLRTAGVPAPYLLAGHSLGGLCTSVIPTPSSRRSRTCSPDSPEIPIPEVVESRPHHGELLPLMPARHHVPRAKSPITPRACKARAKYS
jgi:alpha/beta hydrolase family protein